MKYRIMTNGYDQYKIQEMTPTGIDAYTWKDCTAKGFTVPYIYKTLKEAKKHVEELELAENIRTATWVPIDEYSDTKEEV